MLWLIQLLLVLIIVPLEIAPIGRHLSLLQGAPELALIAVWAFTWFGSWGLGLRLAILMGLLLDLIGFAPIGGWTLGLILAVFVIDLLQRRFFEVSSLALALGSLLICNLGLLGIQALIHHLLAWPAILIGISSNLVIGLVLYYILAVRFRFSLHWKGRRL